MVSSLWVRSHSYQPGRHSRYQHITRIAYTGPHLSRVWSSHAFCASKKIIAEKSAIAPDFRYSSYASLESTTGLSDESGKVHVDFIGCCQIDFTVRALHRQRRRGFFKFLMAITCRESARCALSDHILTSYGEAIPALSVSRKFTFLGVTWAHVYGQEGVNKQPNS